MIRRVEFFERELKGVGVVQVSLNVDSNHKDCFDIGVISVYASDDTNEHRDIIFTKRTSSAIGAVSSFKKWVSTIGAKSNKELREVFFSKGRVESNECN